MTDLELIYAVQEKRDSAAMTELINRHTGIYVQMIQQYTIYPDFTNKVNVDELKEHKMQNIYDWALKYDPTRGMKFSSYVGDRARHMCQNLLRRGPENIQLDERTAATNEANVTQQIDRETGLEEVRREAAKVVDPKFQRIFGLRFAGNRVRSWREIGRQMGLSHEAVRKIFNRHLPAMRRHLKA